MKKNLWGDWIDDLSYEYKIMYDGHTYRKMKVPVQKKTVTVVKEPPKPRQTIRLDTSNVNLSELLISACQHLGMSWKEEELIVSYYTDVRHWRDPAAWVTLYRGNIARLDRVSEWVDVVIAKINSTEALYKDALQNGKAR
jgi:hypothetical protein